MVIVVVIVIIPIMVGVPTMPIFIPPAMIVLPAVGTCSGKFLPPMLRLVALPTVVLDRFVKVMVCLSDALLTIVRTHRRGA